MASEDASTDRHRLGLPAPVLRDLAFALVRLGGIGLAAIGVSGGVRSDTDEASAQVTAFTADTLVRTRTILRALARDLVALGDRIPQLRPDLDPVVSELLAAISASRRLDLSEAAGHAWEAVVGLRSAERTAATLIQDGTIQDPTGALLEQLRRGGRAGALAVSWPPRSVAQLGGASNTVGEVLGQGLPKDRGSLANGGLVPGQGFATSVDI